MDGPRFDALARRTAGALGRRSLVGAVAGAALAVAVSPRTFAKKDSHHDDDDGHHGGGGNHGGGNNHGKDKDKKDKNCGELARSCVKQVINHCQLNYPYNVDQQNNCRTLYFECCGIYKKCKINEGDQCIRDVNSLLLG
jgi:hypothetical protein